MREIAAPSCVAAKAAPRSRRLSLRNSRHIDPRLFTRPEAGKIHHSERRRHMGGRFLEDRMSLLPVQGRFTSAVPLRFRIFLMPVADSTSGARALQRSRTGRSLHGRISSTRQLLNYIHLFRADAFRRKPYGECNGWRITRENINPAMN
jgi:hypothetical protein